MNWTSLLLLIVLLIITNNFVASLFVDDADVFYASTYYGQFLEFSLYLMWNILGAAFGAVASHSKIIILKKYTYLPFRFIPYYVFVYITEAHMWTIKPTNDTYNRINSKVSRN